MLVDWSPLALRRVNQIIDHIAKHNVHAARNWIDQLLNTVELLNNFPDVVAVWSQQSKPKSGTSGWFISRDLWIDGDWVQVLTVRHGMQRELRRYRRR